MSNQNDNILSWFGSLFQHILSFFKNDVEPIEKKIALFADKVTNDLKNVTSSDGFKTILSGLGAAATAIDPALAPMIQGIELAIPKIVNTVAGVDATIQAEANKTLAEQAADALAKIGATKATDPAIYAGLQGTINTAIQHYVTSNNGIVASPAELIAAAQAVHAS